jgi:hypothetical protein
MTSKVDHYTKGLVNRVHYSALPPYNGITQALFLSLILTFRPISEISVIRGRVPRPLRSEGAPLEQFTDVLMYNDDGSPANAPANPLT